MAFYALVFEYRNDPPVGVTTNGIQAEKIAELMNLNRSGTDAPNVIVLEVRDLDQVSIPDVHR